MWTGIHWGDSQTQMLSENFPKSNYEQDRTANISLNADIVAK